MGADGSPPQGDVNSRWVVGLLVASVIVAAGILASVLIRETGGAVAAAFAAAIICNLVGALVFEWYSKNKGEKIGGAVIGAMALLMLLGALPLLWVADPSPWMRENPLTFGFIILLAGFLRSRLRSRWPLYAVAVILGAAHIAISLF